MQKNFCCDTPQCGHTLSPSQWGRGPGDTGHPWQLSVTLFTTLATGPGLLWYLLQEAKYTGGYVPGLERERAED